MEKEAFINVMKRYELKYRLSKDQFAYFKKEISKYMKIDQYGLTSIASLYFDTPDFLLINRSIEKPKYKEKLRLRSYGLASDKTKTYLEIKTTGMGSLFKLSYKVELLVNDSEKQLIDEIRIKNSNLEISLLPYVESSKSL